jgi:hypothetical protein
MKQESNIEETRDRKIKDIETEFNHNFPYLHLCIINNRGSEQKKHDVKEVNAPELTPEQVAQDKVIIDETMTVEQLENTLLRCFGYIAKVYRRSGNVWLQTKFTNGWTLKEQNQMGEDIS